MYTINFIYYFFIVPYFDSVFQDLAAMNGKDEILRYLDSVESKQTQADPKVSRP